MEKTFSKNNMKKSIACTKINKLLEDLEDRLDEAPGFLGWAVVKPEELIVTLNKIKNELPEEISKATDIVQQKERIIAEAEAKAKEIYELAERKARDIVDAGEREAERLVSETYVMKKANQEANNAILDAQKQAKDAISYANNYVEGAFDCILKGIEYLQNDTAKAKETTISKLQSEERRYSVAEDTNYSREAQSYAKEEKEDLGEFEDYE